MSKVHMPCWGPTPRQFLPGTFAGAGPLGVGGGGGRLAPIMCFPNTTPNPRTAVCPDSRDHWLTSSSPPPPPAAGALQCCSTPAENDA